MIVEVLTFKGCPHGDQALELARTALSEFGSGLGVRLVLVTEREVEQRRFLGSPSVRIDGPDIEPGAELRTDYSHSCRLYQTSTGASPLPEVAWIHEKLITGQRS